jgi:hypothetical protein
VARTATAGSLTLPAVAPTAPLSVNSVASPQRSSVARTATAGSLSLPAVAPAVPSVNNAASPQRSSLARTATAGGLSLPAVAPTAPSVVNSVASPQRSSLARTATAGSLSRPAVAPTMPSVNNVASPQRSSLARTAAAGGLSLPAVASAAPSTVITEVSPEVSGDNGKFLANSWLSSGTDVDLKGEDYDFEAFLAKSLLENIAAFDNAALENHASSSGSMALQHTTSASVTPASNGDNRDLDAILGLAPSGNSSHATATTTNGAVGGSAFANVNAAARPRSSGTAQQQPSLGWSARQHYHPESIGALMGMTLQEANQYMANLHQGVVDETADGSATATQLPQAQASSGQTNHGQVKQRQNNKGQSNPRQPHPGQCFAGQATVGQTNGRQATGGHLNQGQSSQQYTNGASANSGHTGQNQAASRQVQQNGITHGQMNHGQATLAHFNVNHAGQGGSTLINGIPQVSEPSHSEAFQCLSGWPTTLLIGRVEQIVGAATPAQLVKLQQSKRATTKPTKIQKKAVTEKRASRLRTVVLDVIGFSELIVCLQKPVKEINRPIRETASPGQQESLAPILRPRAAVQHLLARQHALSGNPAYQAAVGTQGNIFNHPAAIQAQSMGQAHPGALLSQQNIMNQTHQGVAAPQHQFLNQGQQAVTASPQMFNNQTFNGIQANLSQPLNQLQNGVFGNQSNGFNGMNGMNGMNGVNAGAMNQAPVQSSWVAFDTVTGRIINLTPGQFQGNFLAPNFGQAPTQYHGPFMGQHHPQQPMNQMGAQQSVQPGAMPYGQQLMGQAMGVARGNVRMSPTPQHHPPRGSPNVPTYAVLLMEGHRRGLTQSPQQFPVTGGFNQPQQQPANLRARGPVFQNNQGVSSAQQRTPIIIDLDADDQMDTT